MSKEVHRSVHLKPFVPGEETEGSHGVTHKEPVDGLLHQVVEGLQGSDGGQAAQGGALPNEVGGLLFYNNNEEFHLEANQVS